MSLFPTTKSWYKLTLGGSMLYLACITFVFLVSLLPMRVLYALSDLIYLCLYKLAGYRTKVVRKNLAQSFPEKSQEELKQIERDFYHWLCDYIVETFKLLTISKKEMQRRVTYHGIEHIERIAANGQNVAAYIGHYGNWEWITSIGLHISTLMHPCQVYHELENKPFDSIMLKIRESMGTENIHMPNILRRIVQCRREGKLMLVGFISDQAPVYMSTHYWTDFLNHKDTIVITGTERLAKQCNFGCVYLDVRRPRRGYYDITVVPMVDNAKGIPDWDITEQYFRLLEKTIQRDPAIWLWSHNRWKRTREGYEEWNRNCNKTDSAERHNL